MLYLDCLWSELYGTINANLWAGLITDEQAGYLRKKYLKTIWFYYTYKNWILD
ncbi:hypothetical protein LAD12857_15510 [Lacrimispora amygdalina]|uniref:Uncharacterized protein n=1 Tax=Lacrimispora amygdalina TaxID=253257 RepID=A0ABQ5M3V0_9FIRM